MRYASTPLIPEAEWPDCLRWTFFLLLLQILTFHLAGFGSPRSPTTALEEMSERFMQDMRPPGLASKVTPDPTLLRSIGFRVIQRWVRERVDG